jgi:hypothetical protein
MSCCGEGRAQLKSALPNQKPYNLMPVRPVYFEATGDHSVTVKGRATGRTYVFGGAGARVAVDERDERSLMGVPMLRRIQLF